MSDDRFWQAAYDPGIGDMDPGLWETTYVDKVKTVFAERGNQPALFYMGVEITYSELDRYANRFARMLKANGLEKGDVVGIHLPNIPEFVIAWLGTLKAGCVVTGVSPLLSTEEMAFQLNDCKARCLVTLDALFAEKFTAIAADLPALDLVVAASVGGFLPGIKRFLGKLLGKIPKGRVVPVAGKKVLKMEEVTRAGRFDGAVPDAHLTPDDLAYIMYTGGTTGDPKGAMITHRNALADVIIVTTWLGLNPAGGCGLSGFPMFHIAGLFFCSCLIFLGWRQVLIPNPRDTDHICSELEKFTPGFIANVPSLYFLLMSNPRFATLDHSEMDICLSAASPFPEESQKALESIIGKNKLLEAYGMSETSPLTVMNPARGRKKLGSIGLPLPNTHLKLINPDTGETVKTGESGEICVRGPMVMSEYHGNNDDSKKAIDSEGFMRTGDVAVMDETGYLTIVDRTKDMINVSGFKVFSKKVEDILTRHPAVEMVAIIGRPDPQRPGSETVKAFLTLAAGYHSAGSEESIKAEITAFAKDKLTPYEVPKSIEIREELPLTTVGKLDKKQLRG